ncbi:lysozyme [Desulfopila aestuarii]|uniref:Lysozyme n=1 Tax=Desulfopila aestuarii DSM 18488 TaxID=1121416 RepID=A0A1M7YJN3_9BACT|nr:lysozyme [Desulfopila aestuarii]SHO52823.1 lysozyme [Desulfopila aestuarii DSM 18488]
MSMLELAKGLARRFEGVRLVRYLCPAGYPTIGYGHRCAPDQPPIDETEAEILLENDMLASYHQGVKHCRQLIDADNGKQAAIADFVFNLGSGRWRSSTFRRRVQDGDWDAAAAECRRWVHGGGRKLPGLVLRREAEVALMLLKK